MTAPKLSNITYNLAIEEVRQRLKRAGMDPIDPGLAAHLINVAITNLANRVIDTDLYLVEQTMTVPTTSKVQVSGSVVAILKDGFDYEVSGVTSVADENNPSGIAIVSRRALDALLQNSLTADVPYAAYFSGKLEVHYPAVDDLPTQLDVVYLRNPALADASLNLIGDSVTIDAPASQYPALIADVLQMLGATK